MTENFISRINLKHLVVIYVIIRLLFLVVLVTTDSASFDNDISIYYDYGSRAVDGEYSKMEYPQGALFLFYLGSLFSQNLDNFRIIFPLIEIPFGILIIYALYQIGSYYNNKEFGILSSLFYSLSPLLAWYWFFRFDEIVISLTLLSMLFFIKKKYSYSGIVCAFGFLVKWFPILLIPTFVIYLLKKREYKNISNFILPTIVIIIIILLPFYLINTENFLFTYLTQVDRTFIGESIFYLFEYSLTGVDILTYESVNPAPVYFSNNVAITIQLGSMLILLFYMIKKINKNNYITFSSLFIILFAMLNRIYSTQFIIWIIPLLLISIISLKIDNKRRYFLLFIIILMHIFNFIKSPITPDYWLIASGLFWLSLIVTYIYILYQITKSNNLQLKEGV